MMKYALIIAALLLGAPLRATAGPLPRKLLQAVTPGVIAAPVSGGAIADTNVWKSYGNAATSVLQNDAQAQARAGMAQSVTQLVADTNKIAQMDLATRHAATQSAMQAVVQEAASDIPHPGHDAAREAYDIAQVATYGQGLHLDTSNRAARANTNAQAAIQANMDNAFAATQAAHQATTAVAYPASHQWTK